MVVILPYCIKAKRCEHNALGYWSGLALCLTKVRSSRARCPATALIDSLSSICMENSALSLNCLKCFKQSVCTLNKQRDTNKQTKTGKFKEEIGYIILQLLQTMLQLSTTCYSIKQESSQLLF